MWYLAKFHHQNDTTMKAGVGKSLGHEIGYVALVTVTLILLSILVFPLFIAVLPMAVVVGCATIWHVDFMNKRR